jgi:replicative DNA helicase
MEDILSIEQSVLSYILSSPENYKDVLIKLNEDHFSNQLCVDLFKLITSINQKHIEPNIITVKNENQNRELISKKDFIEIIKWQTSISYYTPINDYIEILNDNRIKRLLSKKITTTSFKLNDNIKGNDICHELIKDLNDLLDLKEDKEALTMLELTQHERESFYNRKALSESGKTTGLNSGINSLNKFTGGFQSEFVILAGRPSMGKTAAALFHACNFNEPGIYFNLEMNKSQLCQRLILQNQVDEINSAKLRDGTLSKEEILAFEKTVGVIEKIPIKIYDKSRCGVHEAIRIIKKEVKKNNCKWVIIDYLQLMTIEGHKGNNRELEVAEISRTLKATQKELNITIIALAQLSRQVEQRQNKKPILSDLRESGSIEQDADTVIFIYRPEYYGLINENTNEPYTNEVFYLFEKHRQGATGEVLFKHNNTITKFYDNDNSIINNNKSIKRNNYYDVEKDDPF